jgi:hygromycin-B 7''-O-kinase
MITPPKFASLQELALYRQAVGLVQHHTMDVLEPISVLFPLQDFGTLDELATELFAV